MSKILTASDLDVIQKKPIKREKSSVIVAREDNFYQRLTYILQKPIYTA